jgi:DNA polymerase-1
MSGTFKKVVFKFNSFRILKDPSELEELNKHPILAIDIEGTGLRFESDRMLTVAFSWTDKDAVVVPYDQIYHNPMMQEVWKQALKKFFQTNKSKYVMHNGLFDGKFLVHELFMEHKNDHLGRVEGVNSIPFEDTMLMYYLCANSTARPEKGLKVLTKEYTGDYALDMTDNLSLPLDELAKYNGTDTCATFWLYEKLVKQLKEEEQEAPYEEIIKPSTKYLLNMMLAGLPLHIDKVKDAYNDVDEIFTEAKNLLWNNYYVKEAEEELREKAAEKYNKTHKVKQLTAEDFSDIQFNPASSQQKQLLLFDIMEYEVTEYTKSGAPATGRAVLKEYLSEEHDEERKEVLEGLITVSQTGIILSTFLKTFEELWASVEDDNPIGRLYGNQNLGGTQTARLSSSNPNFANMPSGSKFGKLIKGCFVAPEGWLFAGSDFGALEDRVGAILANDPNKLKEFSDGYDGHSLRCSVFFKEELEERGLFLDPTDPSSINRIKEEASDLRDDSKPISFLKQYGGGISKIMKVMGCGRERATAINDSYDELYSATLKYSQKNAMFARQHGYVIGAYGIKLRTPGIYSADDGIRSSEERSLNNMTVQSWGLLTNRAGIKMQEAIERDRMEDKVILINQIHDALYLLIRDDPEVIKWTNDNLIKYMVEDFVEDQPIPLTAELDIGYSWKNQITLPNGIGIAEIKEHRQKLDAA